MGLRSEAFGGGGDDSAAAALDLFLLRLPLLQVLDEALRFLGGIERLEHDLIATAVDDADLNGGRRAKRILDVRLPDRACRSDGIDRWSGPRAQGDAADE